MKTYSAKPADVTRKWYVIDASQAPLGRVATQIATLLLGKGKTQFTHHIDTGDYVIVINSAHIQVTGGKLDKKMYYRHSGFPGGLTETVMRDKMEHNPTAVIFQAVRGMLPVNKLRDARLERLKIYPEAEHQHEAQKPEVISVKEAAKPAKKSNEEKK